MRSFASKLSTLCALGFLCFSGSSRAANFTTAVTQAAGQNWNAAIWEPGPVAPLAGNTYECVSNGTAFGAAQANTRIRNPAVAGLQTFVGDSLTLNTNTEIRAKAPGAILNFPGVGGKPGLILNGGVLNAGDDAVFAITGRVQVASTSFICPGDNGAGALRPLRGIKITGQLSGNGTLFIYQAGTDVAQEISGNNNSFTGDFILKAGWLKGSGTNSLGIGNILVDPLVPVDVDASSTPLEGPALFEVMYDMNTPGKLTLQNGGMMNLHQNCIFSEVIIEGTSLSGGVHPYSELVGTFPNNFSPDGSGSITIQAPSAPSPPTNVTVINGDAQVSLAWLPAPTAIGYNVNRSSASGGPYTTVASVAGTSFVNTGLANGATYYYVIAATNAFGVSANSGEVVGRPNVPVSGLAAAGGAGKVTLTWNSLPGATSYSVQRATTAGGPYTTVASGLSAATYVDTSVQSGNQYYYTVLAQLNGGFESGLSPEVSAITTPAAPVLAASLFAATVISVKFTTPDVVPPLFLLERSTNGITFSALATMTNGNSTFIDAGLLLGTTYFYRGKAKNSSGVSDYSTVTSYTTPKFGINVNFANAINGTPANNQAPTPPGYVQDVGDVFDARGNGYSYGWDRDITPDGRWRMNAASADLRYDTFTHFQKQLPSAIWEIEIPNGSYQVHVVSGDPTATDSVFQHDIEGIVTESYTPMTGAWWNEWTVQCEVTDGRLTVTSGPDGANNKINFIDIYPATAAAPAFVTTTLTGATLMITWTGSGRLQEAPDVNGTWTDVNGNPKDSFTAPAMGPRKFYRLVSP